MPLIPCICRQQCRVSCKRRLRLWLGGRPPSDPPRTCRRRPWEGLGRWRPSCRRWSYHHQGQPHHGGTHRRLLKKKCFIKISRVLPILHTISFFCYQPVFPAWTRRSSIWVTANEAELSDFRYVLSSAINCLLYAEAHILLCLAKSFSKFAEISEHTWRRNSLNFFMTILLTGPPWITPSRK